MESSTFATKRVYAALERRSCEVRDVLARYGASNPQVFGSVARGDASETSDLDLIVDLAPGGGNELLRVAGIAEELSDILDISVDVVAATLLRQEVSATARHDAVAL